MSDKTQGHTPTPWRLRTSGNVGNAIEAQSGKNYGEGDDGFRIVASFQECTASDKYIDHRENAAANGEFIVRAVNSHDELLAALKTLVRVETEANPHWNSITTPDEIVAACAAIHKAETGR